MMPESYGNVKRGNDECNEVVEEAATRGESENASC